MKYLSISSLFYTAFISACVVFNAAAETTWQEIETTKSFSVRHEAGFVKFENKGYLIGGRGIKAVDTFDPNLLTWRPLQQSASALILFIGHWGKRLIQETHKPTHSKPTH
jgi:hypothetical protein